MCVGPERDGRVRVTELFSHDVHRHACDKQHRLVDVSQVVVVPTSAQS
jgi:hypothetical protein